jgi:hypothetical protein
MNAPLIYTHADMILAMEGCTTRVTDEVTHDVCARISAWLIDRSQSRRGDNDEHAECLEEAALDILDGEWRRPIPAKPDAEG